jgi:hypothetical protein
LELFAVNRPHAGEPDYANAYVVDEIRTLGKVLSDLERQSLQKEMKSVNSQESADLRIFLRSWFYNMNITISILLWYR